MENSEVDTGLRHRKTVTPDKDGGVAEKAATYMKAVAAVVPKQFAPYILKATPYIAKLAVVVENCIPIIFAAYGKAMVLKQQLAPYRLDLLVPSLIGLVMCFFGGSFLTLIAAVEAYKMCGYEKTLECIEDLREDFEKFVEANKHDDAKDDDNDGIPDTQQISPQALVTRKTMLFLKTVDPKRVTEALLGINSGFLSVIATLKLQFARAITLGHAIGSIVERPALKYCAPALEVILTPDYKKWAVPIISYSVKSTAISIAWFIQRIISAFHSAMRGGHMFSMNMLIYLKTMGYSSINHEETELDEIVGYALTALGLWFQLSNGFKLPFLLGVILFPFSVMEWFLVWAVTSR